jgi:nucleoside phosphorylase
VSVSFSKDDHGGDGTVSRVVEVPSCRQHGFQRTLRELSPEAIGGEMDAGCSYAASHEHEVDWILVKAICDFADGHKSKRKEENQALAAANAAAYVRHSLGFSQTDWKR